MNPDEQQAKYHITAQQLQVVRSKLEKARMINRPSPPKENRSATAVKKKPQAPLLWKHAVSLNRLLQATWDIVTEEWGDLLLASFESGDEAAAQYLGSVQSVHK